MLPQYAALETSEGSEGDSKSVNSEAMCLTELSKRCENLSIVQPEIIDDSTVTEFTTECQDISVQVIVNHNSAHHAVLSNKKNAKKKKKLKQLKTKNANAQGILHDTNLVQNVPQQIFAHETNIVQFPVVTLPGPYPSNLISMYASSSSLRSPNNKNVVNSYPVLCNKNACMQTTKLPQINTPHTQQFLQDNQNTPNTPHAQNFYSDDQSAPNILHNQLFQDDQSTSNTPHTQHLYQDNQSTPNTPHTQQFARNNESAPNTPHTQYFHVNQSPPNTLHTHLFRNNQSPPNTPHTKKFQYSQSAPNTPHTQQLIKVNGIANPYLDGVIPHYLSNVMHHPLLIRSISTDPYYYARQSTHPSNFVNNNVNNEITLCKPVSKKNKKPKTKEQVTDEFKFEPYLTEEQVNAGLLSNSLLEGVIRINPKQFQHSYVSSSSDRNEQDILLDGIKYRNRALEGDIVVVQLLPDSPTSKQENLQKKGKVVYIKEKVHNRKCIGVLKLQPDKNPQKALFVPRDHRIPRLNIPFASWPVNFYNNSKSYENTLFLAEITDWSNTKFATGKIICNIGQSGDMKTETQAILAQTDLNVSPFGVELRHLFPSLDYIIPEEEINIREDCRKLCIFSIDPHNCRDIDDALSCRKLDNGNYEIGVHIADVAHFLTENTLLDEKVADKATTIYLVEKAYHMLPEELCMLCSLFPGVDKLTFSVFFEITSEGVVISHRFSKTIINSCCQLAYEHCQAILDETTSAELAFPKIFNDFQDSDIYTSIKILGKISSTLRKNRFNNGALRIDQPKVSLHLNAMNDLPESFWIYESKESHQLIEEFMLLANISVASRIHEDFPNLAFLRCHPPPSGYMLRQLSKALKPMGIELDISTAGDLHKSLLPYVGPDCADKGKAMVLSMLCAKPMSRAKYFCASGCSDDDFHHYALNVSLYTHFTSPIRRYADIMVHRLLAASLKYTEDPKWEVDKVRMIAAHCNKQKYNAKKAGELSTELYMLKYIEMHSPVVTDAVVVEVKEKYIDVIIVAMGLNRRIFFNNDFPGEHQCIKNEAGSKLSKMELKWNSADNSEPIQQVIEVFSLLKVEMHKGDDMVKVETKLVKPEQ